MQKFAPLRFKLFLLIFSFFLKLLASYAIPLQFKEGMLLRDSEIEETLASFLKPALLKQKIPLNINLCLVCSPVVNAFATPDQFIYFNTGLLENAGCAEEIIAVLFHELGHIVGHHGIQRMDALKNSRYHTILPLLLGAIAAGGTKNLEALNVGAALGMAMSDFSLCSYTRAQEASADQFSLNMLDQLNWPVQGMIDFMSKGEQRERFYFNYLYPYFRTHPFSKERLEAGKAYLEKRTKKEQASLEKRLNLDSGKVYLEDRLDLDAGKASLKKRTKKEQASLEKHLASAIKNQLPKHFSYLFQKLKVKVIAFSSSLNKALRAIEILDVPASLKDYGKAIVYYRLGNTAKALSALERFFASNPESAPFVYELKAQILFQESRTSEAIAAIQKALSYRPNDPLFITMEAQMMIESGKDQYLKKAVKDIEKILFSTHTLLPDPEIWHWLGVAYGRLNQKGRMRVCLAESAFILQDIEKAKFHITCAFNSLSSSDPYYQKAKDLKRILYE